MTVTASDPLTAFQWARCPEADQWLRQIVRDFLDRCPPAAALAQRMREETGTRFFDWIDSITLPRDLDPMARRCGFSSSLDARLLQHPQGMFPRLILRPSPGISVALKVESVADFVAAQGLDVPIEGPPLNPMRRAIVGRGEQTELLVTERHGWHTDNLSAASAEKRLASCQHLEAFRIRRRHFADEAEGFRHVRKLIDAAMADLGVDWTCSLFFAAEREYWQRRNDAAQIQKARQDRLGLGWANHDHHTYRSSRRHFPELIALFERLGFQLRERFYSGRDAGWGAQIVEQPRAGIVIFADLDLAPEEVRIDFAHQLLPERKSLGTVGLWCGLHGEAMLEAGLHHLECQFDFAALSKQLELGYGINIMKPFTDYAYLRQAFTEGQRWPVREERLQKLLAAGLITGDQAEQFRKNGALGSHLENLERNEGYKGFNQKGISEIITATDPRA